MVSPQKGSGFRPPTRKKRSSSLSDDKPLLRCLKVNDNNVGSSGKSVPILEQPNELCSTDQSKLRGICSADEKIDDAFAGKVGDVAVRKAVTEGKRFFSLLAQSILTYPVPVYKCAEMKKLWCQLLSEFPQGPIKRKVYQRFFHTQDSNTNSRSLVKTETTSSTATLNPTVEIPEQRFMAGAGKDLPEHAMVCVINHEELCLDASAVDDPDKLLANTLFESPFILFVKDADKVMAGNSELYSTFKSRLEKLPDNVVIIGSHAHTDNHKEKVPFEIIVPTNRCM
ncbi:hypothetical protein R3W88_017885 [Solanum pinnatisectum]|uniref:Uncharacterized protein n=1 Tax=Solanum pinnatisectum TaxID=50273 RepID=A0AAV9L5N6_9SOLN|nr:hypothetical protein R3W88_017885 [Solanum pinnatisectum]